MNRKRFDVRLDLNGRLLGMACASVFTAEESTTVVILSEVGRERSATLPGMINLLAQELTKRHPGINRGLGVAWFVQHRPYRSMRYPVFHRVWFTKSDYAKAQFSGATYEPATMEMLECLLGCRLERDVLL
jgi:hypothetical protein